MNLVSTGDEQLRDPLDLLLRDVALVPHAGAERGVARDSTSLYFVVFGAAIGSRMAQIDGVSYGAFIVPGLIMLSVLTESISNSSFGIYMPRWAGTIYEVLSAPISTSRS